LLRVRYCGAARIVDPDGLVASTLSSTCPTHAQHLCYNRPAPGQHLATTCPTPLSQHLSLQMGLGKTLQMLMLVLSYPASPAWALPQEEPWVLRADYMKRLEHTLAIKTTLIVAPATILHQWRDELQKHVGEGGLTGCAPAVLLCCTRLAVLCCCMAACVGLCCDVPCRAALCCVVVVSSCFQRYAPGWWPPSSPTTAECPTIGRRACASSCAWWCIGRLQLSRTHPLLRSRRGVKHYRHGARL
jgi:hypothetical protein